MNRKLKDSLPIICVVIVLIASFFISISFVNASASFKKNNDIWAKESDEIEANYYTYPYDSDTASVKYVSMDIVYGIKKNLVTYHGELPYKQTHKDNDDIIDGFAGFPYSDEDEDCTKTDYWGSIPSSVVKGGTGDTSNNFINKASVEKINDDEIVSLRLYALSHTRKGSFNVGNGFYFVMQFLAGFAAMIVSLVVTAKNLDMTFILHAIHLDTINDLLTKSFIFDKDKHTISVFTGFCLVMLIFAFVSYTIRYVKGAEKTNGIWNIILTMIMGLLVIGMCLSGKTTQLGTTLSNGVSKLLYTVTDAMNDGEGNAFKVDIEDKDNENKIVQMSELSMIYKSYIDIQLCTQFNVNNINELKFSEIGSNTSLLKGFTNSADFSGNLGYYYWFANSSAKNKIVGNKTLPEIGSGEAQEKLSSMITYLQASYNSATAANKSKIVDIVSGFSKPNGARGALLMLAFTIVMVLLGIVLMKYALNVIIAKIELFIALVGLAIAGPLILTNKKKLVETGKFIVGMLFVSIIEITIWSIFFDLIIFTTATMLSAELGRIIVTIAFLLLFLKFNPAIAQKIKQVLDSSTRAISPTFQQGRNALKQKIRQYGREGLNKLDNSQKVVGYDKDGKAITVSRKGSLASRMAHMAVNGLEDANQRKTWSKLNSEAKEAKAENKKKAADAIQRDAENRVKQVEQDIAADAERTKNQINADTERDVNDAIETDVSGNFVGFNMDKLNDEETAHVMDLESLENDKNALVNDAEYKELLREQKDIEEQNKYLTPEERVEMSPEKLEKLKLMQAQIADKQKQIYSKKQKITAAIRDRARLENAAKRGVNVTVGENESVEEAVTRSVNIQAQQDMSEEYTAALQDAINANAAMVDNPEYDDASKISKHKKMSVNRKAVKAQAIAAMKLEELKSGKAVSSDTELQNKADGIADIVEKNNESIVQKVGNSLKHEKENEAIVAVQRAEAKYKSATKFSKARRDAKKEYKEAKKVAEATKNAYNEQVNDTAAMVRAETGTGRVINKATVSDQINSLAKLDQTGDVDIRTSRAVQEEAVVTYKENKAQINNETQTYIKETTDRINNPEAARKSTISNVEARSAEKAKTSEKSSSVKSNTAPVVTAQPEVITQTTPQTQTYTQSAVNKSTVTTQPSSIKSESNINTKSTVQSDVVSTSDTTKVDKSANQHIEKPVEVQTTDTQGTSSKNINNVINKHSIEKPVTTNVETTKPVSQSVKQTSQEQVKYNTSQPEVKSTTIKTSAAQTIPQSEVKSTTYTTQSTSHPIKSVEKQTSTYTKTAEPTTTQSASSSAKPVEKSIVQPVIPSVNNGAQTARKAEQVIDRHNNSVTNNIQSKQTTKQESTTAYKEPSKQNVSQTTITTTETKSASSSQPKQFENNEVQNVTNASKVVNNATSSKTESVKTSSSSVRQESKPTISTSVQNSTTKSIPTSTSMPEVKTAPKPTSNVAPKPESKPISNEAPKPNVAPQPTVPKEKPVIKLTTPKTDKAVQKAATAQATSTIANQKKTQTNETLKAARDTTAEARAKKDAAQSKAEKEQADRELRMAKEREKLAEKRNKEAEKQAKRAEATAKKAEKKQNKTVEKETKKSIKEQSAKVQQDIDNAYTQRTQATTRQDEIAAAAAAQEAIKRKEALKAAEKSHGLNKTPNQDAVSVEELEKNFDKDLESITSTFKHED